MADDAPTRPAHEPVKRTYTDPMRAPVIYFDGVPTLGFNNGIVNLMLAVLLPTADGKTLTEISAVAHLRCNVAAAVQLRELIDKALLIAAPVPEGKSK